MGMARLDQLDLSHNEIASIDSNTFSDLARLRLLDLSENEISHFPPNVFSGLNMLEVLDLTNNPIETDSLSFPVCEFFRGVREVRGFNVARHCDVELEGNLSDLLRYNGDTLEISALGIGALSADMFSEVQSIKHLIAWGNSSAIASLKCLFRTL